MSEQIEKEEVKAKVETEQPKVKAKVETKELADGRIAFKKNGVTILRNKDMKSELTLAGWEVVK